LDTDGNKVSLNPKKNGYEITQKEKQIAEAIKEIALSLGFYAKISEKIGTIKKLNFKGLYYRVSIYGNNLHEIPCLVERKKHYDLPKHKNTRNPACTGFEVVQTGIEDYYGFNIDGNRRFLLWDYTVTHNCLIDIYEGWQLKKPSFTQGGESTINPYAFSFHPSTVEEMESKGGANFKMLCDDSDYYERNRITGQTPSGLWNLFIPAFDGLENYIGPFGESIIDDPTPEQQKYNCGRDHGSKKYIASRIAGYKQKGTPKAMRDLASFTRKHPMCWADCWRTQGGDLGFDKEKLHQRLEELERQITEKKDPRKRGDFWWKLPNDERLISAEDYVKQGFDKYVNQTHKVVWEYDENGPWYMSDMIEQNQSNLRIWDGDKGMFRLRDEPTKILGVDPGKYHTVADAERREDKAKFSYQAAALYDTVKKQFIASLMVKIDSIDVFSEKCLMACIYFNAEALLELNVTETLRWYEQRRHGSFGGGNGGFLKHLYKAEQGQYAQLPGVTTGGGVGGNKDSMFNCVKDYIAFLLHKENHHEIIEQWNAIGGKEEMNKYDMFAASAICLFGERMSFVHIHDSEYGEEEKKEDFKLEHWVGSAHTGIR